MPEFVPSTVIIEDAKIRDYLLSLEHRVGAAKARFFIGHGFEPDEIETFADALRKHVIDNGVGDPIDTGFGTKWISEGPLSCPDGENPSVRSVWLLDSNGIVPRLVSAYPISEG